MLQTRLVVASLLSVLFAACQPSPGDPGGSGGSSGSGGAGGRGGTRGGSGGSGGSGGGGATGGMAGTGGTTGGSGGSGGSPPDGGGMGGDTNSGPCKPDQPNSLFCKPIGAMPKTIKETGLFPSAPDFSKRDPSLHEFAPSPELWSDGMGKQRFLLLPAGMKINNSDRKRWEFPAGTVFIKTFFDDSGMAGASKPIETRFIRRVKEDGVAADYDYAVYKWNAAGTDADLVIDNEGINGNLEQAIQVPITINRTVNGTPLRINNGMQFMHDLPSRKMCGECHEESGMMGQTFIGFDEIRLNSKRTATAPKTQLQEMADAGVFTMPIPAMPATITDNSNDNGRMLRIKRAIFGNCVHCHNGGSVFDMSPDVFVENTVGKETEAQSVKPPMGWLRVVPGNPDNSVVYRQMLRTMLPPPNNATDERLRPMPPIGVADIAVDKAALDDVRAWIMSLPRQ
jgi:hypothetical protein